MRVSVNGVRLFFDVEGASLVPDGPSIREKLLLLHGGPGFDHSIFSVGAFDYLDAELFRQGTKAGKILAESLVPTPLASVRKNYPGAPVVILADEVASGVAAKSRHWVCVLIATSSIGASALAGGYQQVISAKDCTPFGISQHCDDLRRLQACRGLRRSFPRPRWQGHPHPYPRMSLQRARLSLLGSQQAQGI
jgi:hypothetical protein